MRKRKKRFFLNGNLHKTIHISKANNRLTAYDFVDRKIKVYPYSEVERNKQNAFSVAEASEMMNRHPDVFARELYAGNFGDIQREHSIQTKKLGMYFLSEDDMMVARDFFAGVHKGRPRKDGKITSYKVPTREQLRAMIDSGKILYVKENDEFVPIWRARDW